MSDAEVEDSGTAVAAGSPNARPQWRVLLVVVAVAVAAALLGASGGLLLAGSEDQDLKPSSVDVGFAQDMAAHHRQGVKMARIVLQRGSDPEIRQIAFDIAATQNEQMGRMHGWLALWSKPTRPVNGEHMSWMRSPGWHAGGHADDGRMMPGMATEAELERLSSLSPPQLGTYFLKLMIRHHQGGAPMMRAAIERADVAAVRNLARQMLRAQTAEVKTMKRMLAERGSKPFPNPV